MSQLYLIRHGKPRVAHIWNDHDTACRMASSNGLDLSRYGVSETDGGLPICLMCKNNAAKDAA